MAKKPPSQKGRGQVEWDIPISHTFHSASKAIAKGANPFYTVFEATSEPITTLNLSRKLPIRVHNTHGRTDEEAARATLEDLITLGIAPDQSKKPITDQAPEEPTE